MKKKIRLMILIPILIFIVIASFIMYLSLNNKKIDNNKNDLNTYLEGYTLYKYLYKIDNSEIILAPEDFDKDAFNMFKDKLFTYKLSKDLEIYEYTETKKYKKNKLVSNNIQYDKLDYNTLKNHVNDNGSSGYIWINDNNEINKILLYGTLTIYE